MKGAAFFDRDGTINVNFGYVYKTTDLVFVAEIPEIIRHYNDRNIPVVVITNQAGIARGYYTVEEMTHFHDYLNEQLTIQYGAHIDKFYFCPHHPDFTGSCNCRKPKVGMFLQAAKELGINLSESIMYGDKESDALAAKVAGIKKFYLVPNI